MFISKMFTSFNGLEIHSRPNPCRDGCICYLAHLSNRNEGDWSKGTVERDWCKGSVEKTNNGFVLQYWLLKLLITLPDDRTAARTVSVMIECTTALEKKQNVSSIGQNRDSLLFGNTKSNRFNMYA